MRLGFVVALLGALLVACGGQTPATLEFVDMSPAQPRLGDITTLRFRAIDSRGNALAGASVSFSLQETAPGVKITPTTGSTNTSDGIVSTQLVATGRVTSVVVVATSGDKVALTPPITFAGAAPSASEFTFQCGPTDGASSGGMHAIRAYDQTRSMVAGVKLKCTAHVADRNGDGISNAQVSFLTEAGAIGPTETSQTDVVGNADVLYKTSYPLPVETDPSAFSWAPNTDANHTGEYLVPLWMHPYQWSADPIRTAVTNGTFDLNEPRRLDPERFLPDGGRPLLNPRDNLVTMIAVTAGEEAYDDLNNNGQYDKGEPFTDLTEPFVDSNDNGTWDKGERYIDTNGNGKWDGKNGKFDSNTLIWVQNRILWTGLPDIPDLDPAITSDPVFAQILPLPGASTNIPDNGSLAIEYLISDPWFNSMAQDGAGDGCAATIEGPVKSSSSLGDTGARLTYPPYTIVSLQLLDARAPLADGGNPPIEGYAASVDCTLTDSPEQGGAVDVHGMSLSGLVGTP